MRRTEKSFPTRLGSLYGFQEPFIHSFDPDILQVLLGLILVSPGQSSQMHSGRFFREEHLLNEPWLNLEQASKTCRLGLCNAGTPDFPALWSQIKEQPNQIPVDQSMIRDGVLYFQDVCEAWWFTERVDPLPISLPPLLDTFLGV